ncbi:hypothetical protein Taro_012825 [Colocasia esculenta]|uniref:Protein kinase domain-containing protein n=1 Tax=Colocasia esculenta TaxID=4460 RepID=A0A843UE35_COLES|nr:hypothetical protein [Colocasia esculenta]
MMAGEIPGPSGRMFPHNYVPSSMGGLPSERDMNSVSLQTGEEFLAQFLHDRPTSRATAMRTDTDRAHAKRVGFKFDHKFQPGFEDYMSVHGHRRTASDNVLDVDTHGMQMETDGKLSHDFVDEAIKSHCVTEFTQGLGNCSYSSGRSTILQPDKLKFLCSFGGKILPRPSDGKLRYVGGETRIISISKNLSWQELMQKTLHICNQNHTIKYQLPGEDLDALISVSSDEDLQNMVEEYCGLDKGGGSQRIRIFLIISNESENSSFDMESLQNNSEYQYVVAVNGLSPKKMSIGDCPSQMQHDGDSSSMLFSDSLASYLSSHAVNAANPSGPDGTYLRHPSPIFPIPQPATHSPIHSPPFSPMPIHKDTKSSERQSLEDRLVIDQPSENHNHMDNRHFPYGVPKNHPYLHSDVETSEQLLGPHFDYHSPVAELCPSFNLKDCKNCGYSCSVKPALKEKDLCSEKTSRQHSNSQNMISGSTETIGPNHGIPHAFSDPVLQAHGGGHPSCQIEGFFTSSLGFSTSQLTEKSCKEDKKQPWIISNKEINVSELAMVQKLMPTAGMEFDCSDSSALQGSRNITSCTNADCPEQMHQFEGNVDDANIGSQNYHVHPSLSHNFSKHEEKGALHRGISRAPNDATNKSKLLDTNYHLSGVGGAHLSSQLDALENSVPTSSFITFDISSYFPEQQFVSQTGDGKNGIPVPGSWTGETQPSGSSEQLINNVEHKEENVTALKPSVSWINSLSDIAQNDGFACLSMKEVIDENSRKMTSDSSRNYSSHLSQGVAPQNSRHPDQGVSGSTSSAPLGLSNKNDQNLNLHIDDRPNLFLLQRQPADEVLMGKTSLLDQDPVNYPDPHVQDTDLAKFGYKSGKREEIKQRNDLNAKADSEALLTIEDVTDIVPPNIPASPTIVPHAVNQATLDVDISNTSSINLECECEETSTDDVIESVTDAAIAEIEAGIYGLQIIKNVDLEELQELGSGTFGTVYHGKWRGTDVAIKRLRKSCFAGRTSEQERLTKDFWREAQILSKLHHPNVVAFYGVVPDGVGGTLATVTEYMVNGSLRHVLLRKDRLLDLRKRLMIAMDAAFGMEYLHSKDIVHFDLKCDNLLVNMRDTQRPICKVKIAKIHHDLFFWGSSKEGLPVYSI